MIPNDLNQDDWSNSTLSHCISCSRTRLCKLWLMDQIQTMGCFINSVCFTETQLCSFTFVFSMAILMSQFGVE